MRCGVANSEVEFSDWELELFGGGEGEGRADMRVDRTPGKTCAP
jgi:hypothetical protein